MESHESHIPEIVRELRAHVSKALAERDRASAVEIALYAVRERGLPISDLYVCVLGPLLAEIGDAWQHGRERVWEEHFASATVRTIVEALYLDVVKEAAQVSPRGEVAVLACPPDEQHDLGLRMLADRMMLIGWEVYFLGANTPRRELISAAQALKADLVVLTVATHFNRVELRTTIETLARELPGVRVGIGGPAFGRVEDWPEEEILTEAMIGLRPSSGCED
jgi:MerR family transcriptional regulator, light-induced transcriptional regulator